MGGPKGGGVAGAPDFLESQLPQQLGTSRAFKKPRSSVGLLQPLGTSRTFKKLRSSAGFTPATEDITQFPRSLRGERSRDSVGFLQAHSLSSEGTQMALTSRLASLLHSNRVSLHSRIAHRPQHARGECTPALRAHLARFGAQTAGPKSVMLDSFCIYLWLYYAVRGVPPAPGRRRRTRRRWKFNQ